MKFASILRASPAAACAALLLAGAPALADDDRHTESLLHAIKKARLVDLSHTWDKNSPIAGVNPPFEMQLAATHANTRPNPFFDGHLSFTSEVMSFSGQHGAPSIDALGHIGHDNRLFGGINADDSTSNPDGLGASGTGANLAIDRFPKNLIITRGVLLDVARLLQGNQSPLPEKCDNLPNACEITAAHLERAARRQGVKIKRGDTVFIRTGWGQFFSSAPKIYANDAGLSPGPSVGGANWLIRQGARIVGSDTLTFEKLPPVSGTQGQPDFRVFPVHQLLIPGAGMFIIENLNLEELSRLRAYEFVVVIPPLKIKGGTGSALRAFALVSEKRHDRHDD